MANKAEIVCWDTVVVISYLGKHETRYNEILPMIDKAERDELFIVVSEITVAEACKLDNLTPQGVTIGEQVGLIEDWFGQPYVISRIVDRPVARLAAQIQRNYKSKTCDAIILATAILNRADIVYTYDGLKDDGEKKKLLALDGVVPTRVEGKKLAIEVPTEYGQLGLLHV
jgi:predicted nucleic acid-binding protein